MNTWALILAGGPLMAPILLCSLCSWAIMIEKFLYFSAIDKNTQNVKQRIFSLIKENKITDAILFCEETRSPVAKILGAGLLKFGSSKEDIQAAMISASHIQIPILEKRLSVLSTITNIAPLLGFLGTATGLAISFHTIQTRAASLNPVTPGDLAAGIWQALITTIAGLAVAIPAYIVYNYFVSRIETLVREMEQSAEELVDCLSQI